MIGDEANIVIPPIPDKKTPIMYLGSFSSYPASSRLMSILQTINEKQMEWDSKMVHRRSFFEIILELIIMISGRHP